ncbi:LysR family transcriptional regulator [Paractinoplanes abujensis]|uniref:DNA-binding transcriptional LysR family regulator n=1 Tax=Paractinoplanes abujensis TaxID=882441 RepID=A0A7W7CUU1_9ACTN|nr:LysR family transcriptional regulator [Actinoplanes abujensis]MBB4693875.1 DNA-binding transcriptional LysR family regulator [Actinoplanes abujensis]GID21467.1 LysR family transcriptional regulator [Actinoplanes abujensis]
MDLDTATLRAFVTVAAELHFGRAAARLGVSQQALSKRIRRLETDLGAALVDRDDRRSIRLTADGQRVLPQAVAVIRAVDRLGAGRPPERLRVDAMGDHLAPMAWLRRASVTVPVEVTERPPAATAEHLLMAGRAELAFGRAGAVPGPWPADLRRRLVMLEPLAVLVPATHRWAARERLPLAELAGARLWFPMAGAPVEWQDYVAEFAASTGAGIDTRGSTFGFANWAEDVTAGVAPPSLIGEAMRLPDERMRSVPLSDPTPVFPWWLLWRSDIDDATVAELVAAMGFAAGPPSRRDTWMPEADADLRDR